ncbi:DUF3549 family protein [Thalassolituus sp. LLYu03]|uniref:DUF3549 family protein n=1 Tax=Thalassolituus sp. LLYu03 TaxID=3421656 RepID=UPI003D2E0EC7
MTIGELVNKSGARMRVFDMGRRLEEVTEPVFAAFEQLAAPWPSPYLKHAWVGILSWNPTEPGQHNIWFLKLPLDEQNILQPGPRDAFVAHCLRVAAAPEQKHGDAPCSYRPDQGRMAFFHAQALMALGQPATQFYATARAYLSGDIGWDNWQQLGLQGLAEVVARLGDEHNSQLLANAMPFLPAVPRNALLNFLENVRPDQGLTSAINDALSAVVANGASVADLSAFARALSNSVNDGQRSLLLQALLAHPLASEVELLAAIGSRCWRDLDGVVLKAYLERLSGNLQGEGAFNALVADLLTLPGMRIRVMNLLASGGLSDQLNQAVARLFSLVRTGQGNLQ